MTGVLKILVLNGSPRKKSNVADLLIKQTQIFLKRNPSSEIVWENVVIWTLISVMVVCPAVKYKKTEVIVKKLITIVNLMMFEKEFWCKWSALQQP